MIKVSPTYSKNFSFVQISCLPQAQQEAFMQWVPMSSLQKLTINNISLTDCVDYQEYNYWFDFQFQTISGLLETSF